MSEQKPIVVSENRDKKRTAIKLSCKGSLVTYMPLMPYGIPVHHMMEKDFNVIFSPIPDYPVERAAKLYVGVATKLGGTSDAMAELEKLVRVTKEEKEMAATATTSKKGKVKSKAKAKTKTKAKVKTKSKSNGAKKDGDRKPRESAASMFKELILKGSQTDDQIFAEVQKKFQLDDTKRSYVAWYRNSLKKAGKNPPRAKGAKQK